MGRGGGEEEEETLGMFLWMHGTLQKRVCVWMCGNKNSYFFTNQKSRFLDECFLSAHSEITNQEKTTFWKVKTGLC